MTSDSQRLAIGKLNGKDPVAYRFEWKQHGKWVWSPDYPTLAAAERERDYRVTSWGDESRPSEKYREPSNLPNYLGSLDIIMPVVLALPPDKRHEVMRWLPCVKRYRDWLTDLIEATPAQWAEAYLRAMGEYAETS